MKNTDQKDWQTPSKSTCIYEDVCKTFHRICYKECEEFESEEGIKQIEGELFSRQYDRKQNE